jgi:putative molybdopterin biosynthesis protein
MSVYLHDIPLSEAKKQLESALLEANLWQILASEVIPLDETSAGRVLSEPVWAIRSSPHYHASAMDGFALKAENTFGAMATQPVLISCPENAKYVDTGDPLPDWADAVIPIENVESLDNSDSLTSDIRNPLKIRIRSAVVPWSHVRPMGEDIVATQLVLPAGHVLGPYDLGAIAAAGHTTLTVSRRPKVGILPTGTELVPIGSDLRPGDILEYNSLVMAAQIRAMGADPYRYPITKDDFDAICTRVQEAANSCDLVLLNAGSSAGSEDFSASVVEKLGHLLVHGVAVRPGHPVILGMIKRYENDLTSMIPIVGVPGYPVSAALTINIFVEPIISRWLGRHPFEMPTITAQITRKTVSPPGDDDYMRVVVGRVGEKVLCSPISRGAGVITSLVRADGIVILKRGVQGVEAGDEVEVNLFRSKEDIDRTIFCIGSHDVILDLLAHNLSTRDRRFVSSNVGSQAGLVSLRRGEAHLAGSHLLDPKTGRYNLQYVRDYLPGTQVMVVGFVNREQGLIVKPGNPKSIKTLTDLTKKGIKYINRQRGAGTRVLLDYHLLLEGILPNQISGYEDEEYTHLGVAAAIASGRSDCGMGIPAAARALDLDFVPLYQERYDLIIPGVFYASPLLEPVLDLLASALFKAEIHKLPGYDTSIMGNAERI